MGNSKLWRFSDRLPVSIQVAVIFVSLMLVLSTVTFQLLRASTWNDNIDKLLLGVPWATSKNPGTESVPTAHNFTSTPPPSIENFYGGQQPDENSPLFEIPSPAGAPDHEDPPGLMPNPPESGNANSSMVTLESNPPTSTVAAALASSPAPAPSVLVRPTSATSLD